MKHDKIFSSLVVFWENEIEGDVEHITELKKKDYYKPFIVNEILECRIRIQFVLEQIEFFKYPNLEEYDFSSIDYIIEKHKDFLKENNII